ncbi:cyclin-dependent protein kinase [Purpureocillium lilacinum]|nr:cyclin-dependent protein kinase [Purpureocillium lilacinum]
MPLRLRHGGPPRLSSSSSFSSSSSSPTHRYPDTGSPGFTPRARVTEKYRIVGFISSGTYGRVYKAVSRTTPSTRATPTSSSQQANGNGSSAATTGSGGGGFVGAEVAIKKFKPDKEGEQISYTGISQSAIREMSLCSELRHNNVIGLVEIILEDKCIFMVFDYAEHDLLQIIHHHTQQPRHPIPPATVKSIMFQLLNGCQYLHTSWVLHRDLKPANIMVTSAGEVKIGDLGLARRFDKPLHSLFSGDKVVVTIWYRAPELILGSYHYTPAIDMWAVGCIFAELLSLRPIFKGEEAKMDSKKTVPFQRNQMQKIVDIMGLPSRDKWPLLPTMPEYNQLGTLQSPTAHHHPHHSGHHHQHHHHAPGRGYSSSTSSPSGPGRGGGSGNSSSHLEKWYYNTISNATNPPSSATSSSSSNNNNNAPLTSLGPEGYRLLAGLLEYDPSKRLTAAQALQSPLFSTGDRVTNNAFEGLKVEYPHRRVSQDDNDIRTSSLPGTKRSGLPDDSLLRPSKRVKE